MLKKGKLTTFVKSGSNMERVFIAVQDGHTSKMRIVVATSLPFQKVSTALYALTFSGNLVAKKEGRVFRYSIPQEDPEIRVENIVELMRIFHDRSTEQ
jgi:hypothetical protein